MDLHQLVNWTFYMSPNPSLLNDSFHQKWIEGNDWNIARRPMTLEEYHQKSTSNQRSTSNQETVYQKEVSQSSSKGITEKLDGTRKERIENRQKVADTPVLSWQTIPLPDWVQQPTQKQLPIRIKIAEKEHTFLRSISWMLDSAFRYQSGTELTIARMEWLKQVAMDFDKKYHTFYANPMKMQQQILRSATDWDEMAKKSLDTNIIDPLIQVILDWCQVQCWVIKEETQTFHRFFGRSYQEAPEHRQALPVIVIWWDGNHFNPVAWLDGVPAEPKAETIRPLPRIWVREWEKLWYADVEEAVQKEEEPIEKEHTEDSETKIQIPYHIKVGSKVYWQTVLQEMGLETKKRSEKTGKLIDKTIDEMKEEATAAGF